MVCLTGIELGYGKGFVELPCCSPIHGPVKAAVVSQCDKVVIQGMNIDGMLVDMYAGRLVGP